MNPWKSHIKPHKKKNTNGEIKKNKRKTTKSLCLSRQKYSGIHMQDIKRGHGRFVSSAYSVSTALESLLQA